MHKFSFKLQKILEYKEALEKKAKEEHLQKIREKYQDRLLMCDFISVRNNINLDKVQDLMFGNNRISITPNEVKLDRVIHDSNSWIQEYNESDKDEVEKVNNFINGQKDNFMKEVENQIHEIKYKHKHNKPLLDELETLEEGIYNEDMAYLEDDLSMIVEAYYKSGFTDEDDFKERITSSLNTFKNDIFQSCDDIINNNISLLSKL